MTTPLNGADPEFRAWQKIYRLYRPVIITEKIDGTNAAVGVSLDGHVYAQSRKRVITPQTDNHGFATWVHENADALRDALGEGLHFGEWYGKGIGKRYKHLNDEVPKRFALFNVKRWAGVDLPDRVTTVPVLCEDTFSDDLVQSAIMQLRRGEVSPSGARPAEGVVVHFVQANVSFKVTLENDRMSKGEAEALLLPATNAILLEAAA